MDSRRILKVKFTVNELFHQIPVRKLPDIRLICHGFVIREYKEILLISGESGKQKSPRKNLLSTVARIRKDTWSNSCNVSLLHLIVNWNGLSVRVLLYQSAGGGKGQLNMLPVANPIWRILLYFNQHFSHSRLCRSYYR